MLDKIIKELEAKIEECDIILLNSEDMTVFYIHGSMKQGYQEAISIIKQHGPQHPTITDTEIELLAKEFRKENLLSVSFTPDVHSFITGAKAVLSMMPQSEGYEAKLTQAIERMDRARSILNKQDGASNWGMLDTYDLLPHPPKNK